MIIYFLFFTILFGSRLAISKNEVFCVVAGFLVYLLVAFRSIKLGLSDTSGTYLTNFTWVKNNNISNIISNTISSGSISFNLFTKFLQNFTTNFHVYLALIAIPYIYAVTYIIKNYSSYPLLSFNFFIAFYFLYSFFLLRQVFAMGFIIMSYKYLVNRKVLKFVFFVLLASLFHSSALFFIVAYPVCRLIKFGLKNYLFILMTFLVASLNGNPIMQLITKYDPLRASYITNGIYETSGSAFLSSIIINVLLLVFAQFFEKKRTYENNSLYDLITLGSIFLVFTPIVTEFYRVGLYFNIFSIILIAKDFAIIKDMNWKDTRKYIIICIYVLLILGLTIYFFTRGINNMNANPYVFYWNDPVMF